MNGTNRGSLALTPASWIYGAVIRARNNRFDRGRGVARLNVPVISVGNISVGGTGKSPTVRWIAGLVQREGVKPVIAMRGYKAKPGGKSDEAIEHEELLPDVDVLAQPNRVAALEPYLREHPATGCVILDDGFQHRHLARDLDIVLVDAQQPRLDNFLLPAGRLREPAESLARADAVFVTRAARVDDKLARKIESLHGKPPAAWLNHVWMRVCTFSSASPHGQYEAVSWLRGKRVAVLAGLGNAAAFASQVAQAGAAVQACIPARDHEQYTDARMAQINTDLGNAGGLVTTFKDWVKIRRVIDLSAWPTPIIVPELAIECVEGESNCVAMVRDLLMQSHKANT